MKFGIWSIGFVALSTFATPSLAEGQSPPKMILGPDDYSGSQTLWMHNGSMVYVDHLNGTISYGNPKTSLAGIVADHTVLFRGIIRHQGIVDGIAYAFKKNCPPAPYHVEGHFDATADGFVLKGDAPIWDGCTPISYSRSGVNATLKFSNAMSD